MRAVRSGHPPPVMSRYKIFRLIPALSEIDSRWDIAPNQGEVVVRARSPADARLVASAAEADFPEAKAMPGDGVQTDFASAFRDPKLYHVEEDFSGAFSDEGEPGVVAGNLNRDVIKTSR